MDESLAPTPNGSGLLAAVVAMRDLSQLVGIEFGRSLDNESFFFSRLLLLFLIFLSAYIRP